MDAINYTSIGPVLYLNKAGELTQKRMKAVKFCDGLYVTEPDKAQFVNLIVEYDGIKWIESQAPAAKVDPANMAKRMPAILASIKDGRLNELNDYHKELHRRIFNPDAPAIMELKKPERKKAAPLPEGTKKVNVLMFKGCTDEATDKKVIITEVAPHVYTYTYKLKRYGERVKIIFEIDGIYFQGADNGAYIMEREDFNEICAKAYEHARENVADGAAKGMQYFVEVQKRIDAATPAETPQISTKTAETANVSTEGGNAMEAKRMAAIIEPYKDIDKYALTPHYSELLDTVCLVFGIRREDAREMYGLFTYRQWYELLTSIISEPPQSPEIPQTVNYTTDTPKPRETVRKLPKSAIRDFRTTHARKKLGVQGYSMLADASATLAAINMPPIRGDCTFADRAMDKPYR